MVSTPAILTLLGALTAMTIPTVHGGSSSVRGSLTVVHIVCNFLRLRQPSPQLTYHQIRRNLAISGRITALQLYNADNDAKVVDLVNGTVVNITSLGLSSPSFNINRVWIRQCSLPCRKLGALCLL
jgi:hypothetical protein